MDQPIDPSEAHTLAPALREAVAKDIEACGQVRWCDDQVMTRFLRGNIFNKPKASRAEHVQTCAGQLRETLKWRKETRPEVISCSKCLSDPTAHSLRIVGMDKLGRAVGYTCFSQALIRSDADANINHMVWCMEACLDVMKRDGRGADSWLWIADFHGYSMFTDGRPATAKRTAGLLSHYPECLGRAIMLDATVFGALWSMVKGLLNAHTQSKVVFTSVADLQGELSEYCDQEMAGWILREVQENRAMTPPKNNTGPGKRYWLPPDQPGAHDPRGTASFVNSDLYRPAPWLPQPQVKREAAPAAPAPVAAAPTPATPPPAHPPQQPTSPAQPTRPPAAAAPTTVREQVHVAQRPPQPCAAAAPAFGSPPASQYSPRLLIPEETIWGASCAAAACPALCWLLLGSVSFIGFLICAAAVMAAGFHLVSSQRRALAAAFSSHAAPPPQPPPPMTAPSAQLVQSVAPAAPCGVPPTPQRTVSAAPLVPQHRLLQEEPPQQGRQLADLYDGVVVDAIASAQPHQRAKLSAKCGRGEVRSVCGTAVQSFDDAVAAAQRELLAGAAELEVVFENGAAVRIAAPVLGDAPGHLRPRNAAAWVYGALATLRSASQSDDGDAKSAPARSVSPEADGALRSTPHSEHSAQRSTASGLRRRRRDSVSTHDASALSLAPVTVSATVLGKSRSAAGDPGSAHNQVHTTRHSPYSMHPEHSDSAINPGHGYVAPPPTSTVRVVAPGVEATKERVGDATEALWNSHSAWPTGALLHT
eukprot:TRINITY_DN5667_c0_g1_i1.p1 TRINITY_DN5667_c0_g1~~TRINITY_DN5667_c0_g1_i1.p1  ORF type:complete len:787 (+),score=183.97 TRINITY_DN5667_c0_g1_i1:80-2362(+)